MSFLLCCVDECTSRSGQGVPLHSFPNPAKDLRRFRTWVQNIQSGLTLLDDILIFKNRRVCHRHFEVRFQYTMGKFSKLAEPTLYVPGASSVQENFPSMAIDNGSDSVQPQNSSPQNISEMSSVQGIADVIEPMAVDVPIEVIQPENSLQKISGKRKPRASQVSQQEVHLMNSLKGLKAKMRITNKRKESFKARLFLAQKAIKNKEFDSACAKLSPTAQTFIKMQLKLAGKNKKGRRFTLDEKILSLSLYKPSPKAYRLLSEICILPKRKTLQNLLHAVKLRPGVNERMFSDLKQKVSKLPHNYKYCTLIFDEMAISAGLTYNKTEDQITGVEDNGVERSARFCDHVLVFMVRGVIKKFKQPVAFSFCSSTTKTIDLKKQIINIVTKVQACGLHVVTTVCDQGATNVAAINSLINKTREEYIKDNLEWRGGYFEINKKKIYPIFDPPHLMKGIRNNMLNKTLSYKYKGKSCAAKWEHIVALYKSAPGYRGVRLVPKLTAHHVIPEMIPKMKVKHCTQVFSQSVGVALGFMADSGNLPAESRETADILIFFDDLFDSVNGSFHKVIRGKIYKAALTPTSPHHKLWQESIPVLKEMKYMDNRGKVSVVPSLSSWIKTIEAFKNIGLYFHHLGINSLLLRQFNQDPLENFFGAIRAHGQSNIMPNAAAFQAAYKTLLINNITSTHSIGANCEKDKSHCLHKLKYFFKDKPNEETEKIEHTINLDNLSITEIDTEKLINSKNVVDVERCAAIGYCSGWLVKVLKTRVTKGCSLCNGDLETDDVSGFL